MKRMMRSGYGIRRGISLLLMMSLLIALLPAASVAETTMGAYGMVTVTTKNVVIRTSPAGARTGYFAQKGTYPMIGPAIEVDGVTWYNLQTSETGGFVSSKYATANFGSAGMPSTEKKYVDILANTVITKGADAASPELSVGPPSEPITVTIPAGTILQLFDGTPYNATYGGTTKSYMNLYYENVVYHTPYTNDFAKGIMTTDNLNNYISDVTWKASTSTLDRTNAAKGDYLTHALQAALDVLDYYSDTVDGDYGPNTSAAVLDFRADNSIATLSDGNANAEVFQKAFAQATDRIEYLRSTPGLGGTPGTGTPTVSMIQTTAEKVRLRKSYTTSSTYVGMIEESGTILTYTRTQLSGTVTWYYVQYQGTYGWVMGTYVKAYTTPGGGGTVNPITNYGTVTITKKLTAIRKAPNGARTGYSVNKGDVCTMIGPASQAGGYTWYNIRTESGRTGYVRGDCATPTFGSAGMPSTEKKYVQFLYAGMTVTEGNDPSASSLPAPITIPKNTVLQLQTGSSYSVGGITYINVYYDNKVHFTTYTNNFISGLMSTDNVNSYITDVVWAQGLASGDVAGETGGGVTLITGDIRVHAIQAALYQLDLYKEKMDGIFGSKTGTAVRAFKTKYSIAPINETVNSADSVALFTAAMAALQAKRNATDSGDGTVAPVGDFGTVNTVKKGSWAEIDGGSRPLFPKGSVVTVMSVDTKQVFRLYRWSGSNHADVVPYDTADTAALCSVLGFTYPTAHPSSSQLTQIKADGADDYPLYTWPNFRAGFGGTAISGSKEKIPVWVNLNGTVYCASLYVIPHGFDGVSGFSKSKLNGQFYYERNNMYGMMCLHFYGSTTHTSGTVNATHMNNVNYAYNKAAAYFGASKVK